MPSIFESTRDRHEYYKGELIKYGRTHRVEFKDALIGDLCIFIDAMVKLSMEGRVDEVKEIPSPPPIPGESISMPVPPHFIPEGSRCSSCGAELGGRSVDRDKSNSVRTITKCTSCGSLDTFYMNNAMAALLKGHDDEGWTK